mgnify:CR=1 FL=1
MRESAKADLEVSELRRRIVSRREKLKGGMERSKASHSPNRKKKGSRQGFAPPALRRPGLMSEQGRSPARAVNNGAQLTRRSR